MAIYFAKLVIFYENHAILHRNLRIFAQTNQILQIMASDNIERDGMKQSQQGDTLQGTSTPAAKAEQKPHSDVKVVTVERSSFPVWYDYLALVAMFFVAQIIIGYVASVCGLSGEVIASVNSGDGDTLASDIARRVAARATALGYLAGMSFMVVLTLCYRRLRGVRGSVANFSIRGLEPTRLLSLFVVILAASVVIEPLVGLLPGEPDYNYLGRGGWALLSTVVFAPVFEEIIFRGVILESVRSRRGVIAAWLISSLCFGLAHGLPSQICATFVIGMILGFAYLRSGSLLTSIVLHAMNNALAMMTIMLGLGDTSLRESVGGGAYAVIYAISLFIFLVWLYRAVRKIRRMRMVERSIFANGLDEEEQ